MSTEDRRPYVGQRIVFRCEDAQSSTPIYTAEFEVVEPLPRALAPEGALDLQLVTEAWANDEVQAFHTPAAAEPSAKDVLEVTKFAWDFIKDNRPVSDVKDTVTSVIIKGTNPLDYAHAKEFRTGEYRFYAHDSVIKDWILVDTRFRLEGAYGATPSRSEIPFGHYLPSLHFNVLEVFVAWTFNLEGHAEVSQPINLGGPDDVQPQVRLYAKLKLSWIFQSNSVTFGFVANGVRGGWGTGPELAPPALHTVQFDQIGDRTPVS